MRDLPGLLLLTLVAGLCTYASVAVTRINGGAASVWVANGIVTGILLLVPRAAWSPWIVAAAVGEIIARTWVGDPWTLAFGLTAINLLEAWMVAAWVRRDTADLRDAPSLPALSLAALQATLVACVVSATAAIPLLLQEVSTSIGVTWLTWFSAHLLGMVVIATLTVCAFQPRVKLLGRPGHRLDYAGCLLLLAAVSVGIHMQAKYPLLFIGYLPLVLVTFRHGLAGVVVGVSILAFVSGVSAGQGYGPFGLVQEGDPLARTFLWQLYIAAGCLLAFPIAVGSAESRRLGKRLGASEYRYRLLAENSQDLIVQLRPDGTRAYVSPASQEVLGYSPEELIAVPTQLVHPDDRERVRSQLADLFETGGNGVATYRALARDGRLVWLETAARRLDTADGPQVVYAARDVTARVVAEQNQQAAQAQLQAITDHLPALVARFDRDGRYLYANARSRSLVPGVELIGQTLRDLRTPEQYASLSPRVEAVLRGEPQSFDTFLPLPGRAMELRANFVPDRAGDGTVQGFYSVAFDITEAKDHERELARLARVDALTGLANRHMFDERVAAAVGRAIRTGSALMLLSLDLDHFKLINDRLGHAAGDAVLQEFGARIQCAVYDVDVVARLGGDEFVVLVEYSPNATVGEMMAARIVEAMKAPIRVGRETVTVATSIGIGIHDPVQSTTRLLSLADEALYAAKASGRNTWATRTG